VAVADYSINGASGELIGVSGAAARPGTVGVPSSPVFQPSSTGGFSRALDAEYKILEDLATQLGPSSSSVRGTVNIYSELPVCSSCSAVIDQFTARYPNVVVNVSSG
jgi:filamentous hemagglutinin